MEDMSVLRAEFDTLMLSDPSRSRTTVHIATTHPTPLEEATYGKLYLIVEIENTDRINHDIIQALQDELKNVYYQSSEFSPETAFETALQRGNERLHRFITEGVTQWFEHFNAIVAVVRNDLFTFSQVGRMHAFMFRGTRITDITGKSGGNTERRNPLKIFSTIFSGHAQANDRVLLCTSSILDYFSLEKLKRIVVEDLPSATVAKIEQGLLANNAAASFAALFFAFLQAEEPAVDSQPAADRVVRHLTPPERSMDELISKERATKELLSPSILPNFGRALSASFQSIGSLVRTKVLHQPPRRRVPRSARPLPESQRPMPSPGTAARMLRHLGYGVLVGMISIPRYVATLLGYRKRIASNVKDFPQETTRRTNRVIAWIKSMTVAQRVLGLAAIVALFILAQSVISMSTRDASRPQSGTPEEITASIEERLSKATAALSYDDVSGATKLLNEAASLLEDMPNRSKKDKQAVASLQSKIDDVRVRTRRISSPSISTVADLVPHLNSARPSSVVLTAAAAVVATSNPPTILTIALKDGGVTRLVEKEFPDTTFGVPVDAQTVLFGTLKSTPVMLQLKTKTTSEVAMTFPNADRTVVAGSVFQSRLYLLDTSNASIVRASRTASSFGPASLWLKERYPELKDGTGIAVDGSIYVTTSKGALLKFTSGVQQDTSFESIDPPLASPLGVWTSDATSNLYIFEPSQKRIVQLVKSSRTMKAQYVTEEIGNARSFAVDEKSKTVYLLTATSLLSFPLVP